MFGKNNGFCGGPHRNGCINDAEDICVCPSCGYTIEHQRGVPCNSLLCPKCNCHLVRKIVLEMSEDTEPKKKKSPKSDKPYPKVNAALCMGCGECESICPASAISFIESVAFIDESKCEKCRLCVAVCPVEAIS